MGVPAGAALMDSCCGCGRTWRWVMVTSWSSGLTDYLNCVIDNGCGGCSAPAAVTDQASIDSLSAAIYSAISGVDFAAPPIAWGTPYAWPGQSAPYDPDFRMILYAPQINPGTGHWEMTWTNPNPAGPGVGSLGFFYQQALAGGNPAAGMQLFANDWSWMAGCGATGCLDAADPPAYSWLPAITATRLVISGYDGVCVSNRKADSDLGDPVVVNSCGLQSPPGGVLAIDPDDSSTYIAWDPCSLKLPSFKGNVAWIENGGVPDTSICDDCVCSAMSSPRGGLGSMVEGLVKPVGRFLGLGCYDEKGNLKPESGCAKRRDALNGVFRGRKGRLKRGKGTG